MIDLFDELTSIAHAFDANSIRYALVGGLAYSVWVEARSTEDIDLLIDPTAWPAVAKVLEPLGYRALAAEMNFKNIRIRRLTKLGGSDVLVLDFLLADGPLADGLDRAVRLEHGGTIYTIATPDVIITLKQGRMSPKDISDIAGLQKIVDGKR